MPRLKLCVGDEVTVYNVRLHMDVRNMPVFGVFSLDNENGIVGKITRITETADNESNSKFYTVTTSEGKGYAILYPQEDSRYNTGQYSRQVILRGHEWSCPKSPQQRKAFLEYLWTMWP